MVRSDRKFTLDHGVSRQEWEALKTYALDGSQENSARAMGINIQTFKNYLTLARNRLGAKTLLDTYRRLGWLKVPGDETSKHAPGEANHVYALYCTVCGQPGVIRVSVDPGQVES